jgi:hypothetical protein
MCDNAFLSRLVDGEKIIEVSAKPKESDRPNEPTKFEIFKEFAKEKLITAADLAVLAGAGVAHKKNAEARRTYAEAQRAIEEAKKIAAEKENYANSSKWDNVEQRNRIIDDIFRPGQGQIAQIMKFANYIRSDPSILKELENVQDLIDQLSHKANCAIELSNDQLLLETEELSKDAPEAEPEKKE